LNTIVLGAKQQTSTLVLATNFAHHSDHSKLAVKPARTSLQHSPMDVYVYYISWYIQWLNLIIFQNNN